MKQLLLTAMLGAFAAAALAADKPPAEKVLFEAKFTGELGKDWSWVREDPKAWKIDQGALVLRTLPGYLHAKSNDSKNVLLRPLPKSDKTLVVEVYVEGEPKVQFEHAGIVWYVDDDNYVSLFQEVLGGKVELQMVTEKDAKPRTTVVKHDAKGVWMRLLIADGKITTQYRPSEKEEWKTVGKTDAPSAGAARVGVMAGGAPKDAERYVRFRSFRIVEFADVKKAQFGDADDAKIREARRAIEKITTALGAYKIAYGEYPDSLEVLTQKGEKGGPYLTKEEIVDSEKKKFTYQFDDSDPKPIISTTINGKTVTNKDRK